MKLNYLIISLLISSICLFASGGYDNGTPAGKGNVDIDITYNPGDMIDYGQSYLVWGYGITDDFDFHGYISHEANGANQIYYGFMYRFFKSHNLDLSTALGLRNRKNETHLFGPQILYTIKLAHEYEIGGSIVNVYDITGNENLGLTYDIALRIPIHFKPITQYFKSVKFSIGLSRATSKKINPTYSIDMKF